MEQATGEPGVFDRTREELSLRARARELVRRAKRPERPTRRQEYSLLEEIYGQMRKGFIRADQAAILLGVITQLVAADEPLSPQSRIFNEDGERVLEFNAIYGLLGKASGDVAARTLQSLEHLQRNSWVVVSRRGPTVQVRLGTRARRALKEGKK